MAEHGNVFITNIEKETIENNFYRKVLFTTDNQQLVLMSIKPKDDIPYEIHPENDQFVRIEKGKGLLLAGPNKESKYELFDGVSVTIPANTWHQIINTSESDRLKLYTIYSPPHHPRGTIEMEKPKQCDNNPANETPFNNINRSSKRTSLLDISQDQSGGGCSCAFRKQNGGSCFCSSFQKQNGGSCSCSSFQKQKFMKDRILEFKRRNNLY